MIVDGNKITPDDGKTLTNGKVYSKCVFLGVNDSVDNWREINDADVPEEVSDEEAMSILLGVDK